MVLISYWLLVSYHLSFFMCFPFASSPYIHPVRYKYSPLQVDEVHLYISPAPSLGRDSRYPERLTAARGLIATPSPYPLHYKDMRCTLYLMLDQIGYIRRYQHS